MHHQSPWQRYQDWLFFHPKLELWLDVSRMDVDDVDIARLSDRFTHAFAEMAALEGGAIANPDENRQVGHYWLRDPDLAPDDALATTIRKDLEAIRHFAADVHGGRIDADGQPFTDMLCIGIGGSALGPQFVADALAPHDAPLRAHFIDNTDPDGIDRAVSLLGDRLATTLIVVTSKSGGTAETRNGMLEIREAFRAAGHAFAPRAVAVTGIGSKLDRQASDENWLARFPMYDWIGGRTSETSVVGLLPAALQGIDIVELLEGAREMDGATRASTLKSNPAALLALCWHVAGDGRGTRDMVVLPYKDRLLLFSRYLQQLIMESLGKADDLSGRRVNQGLAVYGNKGSTDQHAYVQQLRDGLDNFFVTFVEVLEDRSGRSIDVDDGVTSGDYLSGFLAGTRTALHDNGRQSITITISRVDARRIGALIALFERAVGLYASLVHINAYHQPGVEAGKKAASEVLDLQHRIVDALHKTSEAMTLAALAKAIDARDQIETVHSVARHLAANQRGIELTGDPARPSDLRIRAHRSD